MKYTEDYRRLVGIRGQGRLISGLEGQRTRDAHGAVMMSEDLLDGLALGFGGFEDLGAMYRIIWNDGTTNQVLKTFDAGSDAEALKTFESSKAEVLTGQYMMLNLIGPPGKIIKEGKGTKPSAVPLTKYTLYKNGVLWQEQSFSSEDQAYAWLLVQMRLAYTTDTVVMKRSDGSVWSKQGERVEVKKVQAKVKKIASDGAVTYPTGGSFQEGASGIDQMFTDIVAKSYQNETIVLEIDGNETKRQLGANPVPPPSDKTTPDLGPTNEPPATTDLTTPEETGFQKFMAFMTAKAVPPVPNGAWVGIGVAVVVGIGIYAGTKR